MSHLSPQSDEAIVKMVRQDKEVYAEIIRRYQSKLLRYASYLMADDAMAADVVQESFIRAYENLNSFDTKKKFSSWIYRIVHNHALNAIRKQKPNIPMDSTIDFDSGLDIEDDVVKLELKNHTHNCLHQMPVNYKEPLTLYFLEEKTYEEISDILHIPTSTVGTRISRGKILMRKLCQKLNR